MRRSPEASVILDKANKSNLAATSQRRRSLSYMTVTRPPAGILELQSVKQQVVGWISVTRRMARRASVSAAWFLRDFRKCWQFCVRCFSDVPLTSVVSGLLQRQHHGGKVRCGSKSNPDPTWNDVNFWVYRWGIILHACYGRLTHL